VNLPVLGRLDFSLSATNDIRTGFFGAVVAVSKCPACPNMKGISMAKISSLHVNGGDAQIEAEGERTLLSVLRDDLNLTGPKYGCGEGRCGACTVLLDGVAVRSCQINVGSVGRRKIVTIEGLEQHGQLHPLQTAFLVHDAFQCGYCTCGMIMSGVSLLEKRRNPSEAEIIRFMDGNVCRCGAYQRIVAAIKDAGNTMAGGVK
jgi:aerobic-type carbon monoxide dehydrogenase small subunit (CoxS/CutS family)